MRLIFDIIFINGRIVDGTGNPWVKTDLAIAQGKVAALGKNLQSDAQRVIDVRGLVIAPGFIDLHTHTDRAIVTNNKATSSIMAGVTMEAVGNCGDSAYGFGLDKIESFQRRMPGVKIDWTDLKSYREMLDNKGIGINLAPFFGHNTIRTNMMGAKGKGGERIKPSSDEMHRMKARAPIFLLPVSVNLTNIEDRLRLLGELIGALVPCSDYDAVVHEVGAFCGSQIVLFFSAHEFLDLIPIEASEILSASRINIIDNLRR